MSLTSTLKQIMSLSLAFKEIIMEKETATHSSIHAWEIPWTGESGVLQFMNPFMDQNLVVAKALL